MPTNLPTEDLEAADAAIQFARSVRRLHARRTQKGNPQREADIDQAITRLKEAMKPLKSQIGRFPYGPQTTTAARNRQVIYDTSATIKRERIKLWKMKAR